jgi:hypothetical protein
MEDAFLSPRGGLWVKETKCRKFFGMPAAELKRNHLTVRKRLYRSEKVSRGWQEVWADGDGGPVKFLVLPRRLAEIPLAPCANLLHGTAAPGPVPSAAAAAAAPGIDLFPYQQLCANHVMRHLLSAAQVEAGHAFAYVNLPAGRGKTPTGVEIARAVRASVAAAPRGSVERAFGARTAVVAPRSLIEAQWVDTFREHIPGARVVLLADVKPADRDAAVAEADAVVMTPAMALTFAGPDWARFGLAIFDEAHVMCADKWQGVFPRLTCARVLGLSATTGDRPDGMDPVAYWHLGQPLHVVDLPGYDAEEVRFHGELRVVEVTDPGLSREIRGLDHVKAMQALHTWAPWVARVARETLALLRAEGDIRLGREPPDKFRGTPPQYNVAVFAEYREAVFAYATAIQLAVDAAGLGAAIFAAPPPRRPGDAEDPPCAAAVLGGVKADALGRALETSRVIVTTYGYSSIGVSLNRFNAQIMASTRNSQAYQIMHRVMRINSDTSVHRRFVFLAGPRKNWRLHSRSFKSCARAEGIDVVVEKVREAPG